MEAFGWTEKQLKCENTIWMLERIKLFMELRAKREKQLLEQAKRKRT